MDKNFIKESNCTYINEKFYKLPVKGLNFVGIILLGYIDTKEKVYETNKEFSVLFKTTQNLVTRQLNVLKNSNLIKVSWDKDYNPYLELTDEFKNYLGYDWR